MSIKRVLPLLFAFAAALGAAESSDPLILRSPAVSRTQIVFVYAGDLWTVGRDGGEARQLTTNPGNERNPQFSPDGTMIAFTGQYDGNEDVYVVPAAGGVPKRLTYHPATDVATGWSTDGKRVLFWSSRNSYSRFGRLFTVPVEGGGLPEELPLPMAEEASYSPDGSRIAYMPLARAFDTWKRYRGGRTTPIWIANLADSRIEKIPRENSNDFAPMWIGDQVYFLSDRNGPVTLFSYQPSTKRVTELIRNTGMDLKSATAGPDAIAYEQFGKICLFDLKTRRPRPVDIRVSADLRSVRPSLERVRSYLRNAALSPTGARAVFEARGEILTVPAEKGDVRNLTNTTGTAERSPAWSPDGKSIAFFSDESGEYALHIAAQNGMGDVRRIKLPRHSTTTRTGRPTPRRSCSPRRDSRCGTSNWRRASR